MSLQLTLLYLASIAITGYVALSAVLGPASRHWAQIAGLSFAAGAGIWSIIFFSASLFGVPPNRTILVLTAALTISVLLVRRHHLLKPTLRPSVAKSRPLNRALASLALLVIILTTANVIAAALTPGIGDIDSFAIWLFKAKIVFAQPLHPIPAALLDPQLSFSHQDYPLGFPLLVAGAYAAAGRLDVLAGKLILLPIYFSLIAVIYSALRRYLKCADALIITAVFTSIPVLRQHAGMAVAEVPLILMHTCCLVLLLEWMESENRASLIAATGFAAFAAFTKNEGLALMPILAVAIFLFAAIKRRRKLFADFTISIIVAITLLLPWIIYRRFLPYTHENYGGKLTNLLTLTTDLSRLATVLPPYLGRLFEFNTAGFTWLLLPLVALLGRRAFRQTPVLILWFILVAHLALYALTFMVSPWSLDVLIPMVSAKLLIHIAPTAVLLIGLHLAAFRSAATA